MKTNTPNIFERPLTGGGGFATRITPLQQLRRMSLSALLFEDMAYQKGSTHANEVKELVKQCKPEDVAKLAIEARTKMYLRHMPLFLIRELARTKGNGRHVEFALTEVIQRPDELGEYLALYWRDGKAPLSAASKRALAQAILKFTPYDLAKYNSDNAIKLKDVLRIVHPKPASSEQSKTFKSILEGTLESPDTWEVALSKGANKKDTFERLIREKKLGGLAFLRNLRGMIEARVDEDLIKERFKGGFKYVLPFRFIAAAKYAPKFEPQLEAAMLRAAGDLPKLKGKTVLVIDVSGSMGTGLSAKSDMTRLQAATALAILAREQCEDVDIYCTAGSDYMREHKTELTPARRGMALKDAVLQQESRLGGGGIFLVQCLDHIWREQQPKRPDRLIVFTDEQDCDNKLKPESANTFGKQNYLINISSNKNGVGYGNKWVHIDGFSERVFDYMYELEVSLQ